MKENRTRTTDLLALLCLAVFAVCVLMVLLMGAGVYRNLTDSGQQTHTRRTALQYLATRVRQAETVEVGLFEGCEALILGQTVDGEVYTTRIYCYEGWLRELHTVPGAKVSPSAGEAIFEADAFSVKLAGSLLTVNLGSEELLLYLPVGTEVDT